MKNKAKRKRNRSICIYSRRHGRRWLWKGKGQTCLQGGLAQDDCLMFALWCGRFPLIACFAIAQVLCPNELIARMLGKGGSRKDSGWSYISKPDLTLTIYDNSHTYIVIHIHSQCSCSIISAVFLRVTSFTYTQADRNEHEEHTGLLAHASASTVDVCYKSRYVDWPCSPRNLYWLCSIVYLLIDCPAKKRTSPNY